MGIEQFGVKNPNEVMIVFPSDIMQYGLGEYIIIEVSGLTARRENEDKWIYNALAKKLAQKVQEHFPAAIQVKCMASMFNAVGYAHCSPVRLVPIAELLQQEKMSSELHSFLANGKVERLYDFDPLRLSWSEAPEHLRQEMRNLQAQ
ncbi:MAG: hypothetical protein V4478_01640 [Patescibacteria group bacterium]